MDKFQIKVGEVELPIVSHEIKKGQTKGSSFFGPDFDSLTLQIIVNAFGEEKVVEDLLKPELRRYANQIHKEALVEVTNAKNWRDAVLDGSEQEELFRNRYQQMYADLSPRGLTIKQLKAEISELMETLASIKPVTTVINGIKVPDVNAPETQKFYKIAERLQAKQQALEAKKSDDDSDSAEAPASAAVAA
jgi:hypothetical protein